jgi:hypothetical protein
MLKVNTPDGVYPAVDELVSALNLLGKTELAAKLEHRVHKVAWTTRAELFEELRQVLAGVALTSLPPQVGQQVRVLIDALDGYLKGSTRS